MTCFQRRVSGLLVCVVLVTVVTALGANAQSVFRRGTASDPETLDPHRASAQSATPIIYDMYEGLMALDGAGNLVYGAAESYTVSDDGLVYTFKLRPGLQWSDGTPLTAEDFVYSNQRVLRPETAGRFASYLFPIKNARAVNKGALPAEALGARVVDELTIEYTLEMPMPTFPKIMASNPTVPVPRHVIEALGKEWIRPGNMVTNGAYILAERVPQSYIKLKRNPYYRLADEVKIDEVYYYPTQNLGTSLKRFRNGELDVILNFPPGQLKWIKDNMPDRLHVSPVLGIYYLIVNLKKPPYDDVRVRKALNIALDREIITDKLLKTGVTPAYSFALPSFNHYDGIDIAYRHQPMDARRQEARRLLAEAGFSDSNPLRVEFVYDTQEENRKISVAVAGMWRTIGVETELVNVEFRSLMRKVRTGDFEVSRFAYFAPYNDAITFLTLFHSQDPNNQSGYNNPDYDHLLDQSDLARDPDERQRLMEQAERLLMDDYAMIPIYYYVRRYLVSPAVKGWIDNDRGVNPSQYLWIERE